MLLSYTTGCALLRTISNFSIGRMVWNFAPVGILIILFLYWVTFSKQDTHFTPIIPEVNSLHFRVIPGILAISILFGIILIVLKVNSLTFFSIGIIIIGSFFFALYLSINDNAFGALIIFMLNLPFISYMEWSFRNTPIERFHIGMITLTPTILFLLSIYGLTFMSALRNRRQYYSANRMTKLVIFFIFISFLASITSEHPSKSFEAFLLEIVFPVTLFFVIMIAVDSKKKLLLMLFALVASYLFSIIFAYYFQLRSVFFMETGSTFYSTNIPGITYAGHLALVAALLIPIIIVLGILTKSFWLRAVFFLGAILSIFTLLFTESRGPTMAAVAGLIILLTHKKSRKLIVAGILILFIANIVLQHTTFIKLLFRRYHDINSPEDIFYLSSMLSRRAGWGAALRMIKDYPLLGIGFGAWQDYLPLYANISLNSPHNIYLWLGVNSGLLGLSLYISLLAVTLKKGFLLVRSFKDTEEGLLSLGLLASLFVWIIYTLAEGEFTLDWGSFTDSGFIYMGSGLFFWSIVASIVKLDMISKEQ